MSGLRTLKETSPAKSGGVKACACLTWLGNLQPVTRAFWSWRLSMSQWVIPTESTHDRRACGSYELEGKYSRIGKTLCPWKALTDPARIITVTQQKYEKQEGPTVEPILILHLVIKYLDILWKVVGPCCVRGRRLERERSESSISEDRMSVGFGEQQIPEVRAWTSVNGRQFDKSLETHRCRGCVVDNREWLTNT